MGCCGAPAMGPGASSRGRLKRCDVLHNWNGALANERHRHRMRAHALGTRLTRSAASLACWARVAGIEEEYVPGWRGGVPSVRAPESSPTSSLVPTCDGEVSRARRPANRPSPARFESDKVGGRRLRSGHLWSGISCVLLAYFCRSGNFLERSQQLSGCGPRLVCWPTTCTAGVRRRLW